MPRYARRGVPSARPFTDFLKAFAQLNSPYKFFYFVVSFSIFVSAGEERTHLSLSLARALREHTKERERRERRRLAGEEEKGPPGAAAAAAAAICSDTTKRERERERRVVFKRESWGRR